MNISTLIMAAEFLDRRQTESEHGYALSAPVPVISRSKKSRSGRSVKSRTSRSTHNELEKNRRAHLRNCFDELKRVVPLSNDSSRHTTLELLKQACLVIKEMEDCYRRKQGCLKELIREHSHLLGLQKHLGSDGVYCRNNHSVSESSTCSSVYSGSSGSSEREGSTSDDEDCLSTDPDFDCNLSVSLRL